MKIPIGKHVITSDSYCVILNEKRKYKSGENKGKEYFHPIAYYNSIEHCLSGLLELKIRESETTTIKELLKEIKNINKFIRSEFKKAKGKK